MRRSDERGSSTVELVLYMPLLMIAIIITVQFSLMYLANQSVSAAAREAARIARVTGDATAAEAKGMSVAGALGSGILRDPQVVVTVDPDAQVVRAVAEGHAPVLLPFIVSPTVTEEVSGPIERFDPDGGP